MNSTFLTILLGTIFSISAAAASKAEVTYFSCTVIEPVATPRKAQEMTVAVTVKFAIKRPDATRVNADLIAYPGTTEDDGPIFVQPKEYKGHMAMMTNLNGQGGDLRVLGNGDLHLFGDGDGYQFTDLILWDDGDEERAHTEGYVRDYGSTYGSSEHFKQFINCKKSIGRPL